MESGEQIRRFQEFFELHHHAEILEQIRKEHNFYIIDFMQLSKFDPELSENLLETPQEVLRAAEIAVENFELPAPVKHFRIRVMNLPASQCIKIRNIRSSHIGVFLSVEGIVRQKTDVRPEVTIAKFECPSCGNVISVLQVEEKFKEPSSCGCGRKGKFRVVSKELIDIQRINLEESPEDLDGGEQPKRMYLFLKEDLVSPLTDRKTNPGSKIKVTGYVKEIPVMSKTGGQSIRFDLMIFANHIEPVSEDVYEIEISKEEEKQLVELSQDPKLIKKLVQNIAPSIYGYDSVKLALLLQAVGGVTKIRSDGMRTRGDIHVLLIGDPGAGKCVTGDSKIVLSDGNIKPIRELFDSERNQMIDDGCYTLTDETYLPSFQANARLENNKAMRLWARKSPKQLIRITTKTGNNITTTENHPFFTTNDGFIHSIAASKLRQGDYLALPRRLKIIGALQNAQFSFDKSKARNRNIIQPLPILDQDFARLLGYLVGDGYVRIRKTTGIISFTNKNMELLADFEKLISRFGAKVAKRQKQGNPQVWEYCATSIELVNYLIKIEKSITNKSEGMDIPDIVLKSPDYILKQFLIGLFECEAHVSDREIQISSKSQELIEKLKIALLRFGILSQISKKIKYAANTIEKFKRDYYEMRITGIDVLNYQTEIGFLSRDKANKLKSICSIEKVRNTNKDIIPNLKDVLRIIRKRYNLTQWQMGVSRSAYLHYELGDRNPSKGSLMKIAARLKEIDASDVQIKLISELADSDIFWDSIKDIEILDSKEDYVYDIEVENTHNFICNSIMVHNSQLLKRMSQVAPKSRYVSGKGVTGAGLTATVVKDEFINGWSLEAGALPLCNNGFCMIDELDKMSKDDRNAMHEALEQQTISISKANIQATLKCATTVLAAANPKFGRFDPYEIIAKQIDLPPALITRFDLIFPIRDKPDADKDRKTAHHMLALHQAPIAQEIELDTQFLKKYIAYARQKCHPALTDGAIEDIEEFYIKMRNSGSEDGGVPVVPISPRQLEALIRLSEASAKLRLGDKVTKKDAKAAIEILELCLKDIGLDPDTGKIDIDRISSGISATQRGKIHLIKDIIADIEKSTGQKVIAVEDVIAAAKDKNIEDAEVNDVIEKLRKSGDIFEPKRGFISRL